MNVKVLIVDDSALMRKLFSQLFSRNGLEVVTARDGEEAIDVAVRDKPDVITLDINMPKMDGITCLSLLNKVHPCPIIMLSSLTQKGALVTLEALALGASDYVLKPGGTVSTDISSIESELLSKIQSLTKGISARKAIRKTTVATAPAKKTETPQKAKATPVARTRIDCVLVGVSTGGPKKLEQLLTALPANFKAPIVISQHMPMAFTQALANRLDKLCQLKVVEVSEKMRLMPGTAYIAKGEADVVFLKDGGHLAVRPVPANPNYLWHPSVDRMVESANSQFDPARLLCIQLTGMGCDGVAAMSVSYNRGATVIAESEATATVFGMPRELIEAGCVHHILESHHIAQTVMRICA